MKRGVSLAILFVVILAVAVTLWRPRTVWKYLHRFDSSGLNLVVVAEGLDTPWGFDFLPDGRIVVNERPGRMRVIGRDGRLGPPLAGLPAVFESGEGGLLDVIVEPRAAAEPRLYWCYSEPQATTPPKVVTAVARGRLVGAGLVDVQVIYRQPQAYTDDLHFGCRLQFTPGGQLFVGLGDRWHRDLSQHLDQAVGKLVRIEPDGRVPADNPFVGRSGALPEIWSYGHRNIQGLAYNPATGSLWASEHGPQGGDEINLVRAGANYGWPVITYGCEYGTCKPIGEGTAKAGMEQPLTWFGPNSTPPTGMVFVTSDRYPGWKGHLMLGALRDQPLTRVEVDGDRVVSRERIWLAKYQRLRTLREGPDGWLYATVDAPSGALIRLER